MVKKIKNLFLLFCSVFALASCNKNAEEPTESNYQISFSDVSVSIVVGETYQMNVTAEPNDRIVFYDVRDPEIASITTSGLVTGLRVGETVCYASIGNAKAICNLFVNAEPLESSLSISLNSNEFILSNGDEFELPLVVRYGNSVINDYEVNIDVETSGVISVNNKVITAIGIGETYAIVKAKYNNKEATSLIKIKVI